MESKSISKPVRKSALSETATLVLATTLISLSATWARMISSFKTPLKRLKENSSARIIFTTVIASILVVAGIATLAPTALSDDDGSKIRATGTVSSVIASPDVAIRTVGDLSIQNRLIVSTYTGTLEGKALVFSTLMENTVTKKTYSTLDVVFTGTLLGSAPGSFAAVQHIVGDRSACPCPPGMITAMGTFTVVEGSGQGGLAGICGGGTTSTSGDPVNGFTTTYDYKFRFGKDCKSNS